jgi:ketosteroid isomerase-like protein
LSLDIILELEGDPPDWGACIEAAQAVGVTSLTTKGERLDDATFRDSGGYFWSAENRRGRLSSISAEGKHGCSFETRYCIVFRLNNGAYEMNRDDIHRFCSELAERSLLGFVLSFQLEEVRATRDARGLVWTWDAPR